jgi:cytochrome c5
MKGSGMGARRTWVVAVTGAAAMLAAASAAAQQTGEQVYKSLCIECHGSGKDKAPKFGDKKDWGPRLKEGQARLTAEGLAGVRKMPARGGKADLSLADFANAVAYIARESGGNWKDPDEKMLARIAADEKKILDRRKAKKS